MCDILERDDRDIKNFDEELKKDIKATRDRAVGIIKEVSEFLHHPRSNSRLIETLEFELQGARAVRKLD